MFRLAESFIEKQLPASILAPFPYLCRPLKINL
jgi:hypothetical protein